MSFNAGFFPSCDSSGVMDRKSINLDGSEKTPRYHYLLSVRLVRSSEHIFMTKRN